MGTISEYAQGTVPCLPRKDKEPSVSIGRGASMRFLFQKKPILVLFLILIFVLVLHGCGSRLKYGRWKDSHEAFGDGEYQLLKTTYNDVRTYNLFNMDSNCEILVNVQSYEVDGNQVVLQGKCPAFGYRTLDMILTLNTEDNSVKMIFKDNEIPDEAIKELEQYIAISFPDKPISVEPGRAEDGSQTGD